MQMFFGKECIICESAQFNYQKKRQILGMTSPEKYSCKDCGSVFIEDELKWKLVQFKDKQDPIWQENRQKSLYVREWISIVDLRKLEKELLVLQTNS